LGGIVIKTHVRHSDLKELYGHRSSIPHIVDDALVHLFSFYRLPSNVLAPSIPCCPILHPAVPGSVKAPIAVPTLSDTVVVLSTSFKDALTFYTANHSASMLMNETLHWSSSWANILNRQALVSVDRDYFLDNAELDPFEVESQAQDRELWSMLSLNSTSRKIVSAASILVLCLTIGVYGLLSSLEGCEEILRAHW
jgi:hypothetical protein